MRHFLASIILLISFQNLRAQNNTELVVLKELIFNSTAEQENYLALIDNSPSYFELLASIDSTATTKEISLYMGRFDIVISNINTSKWENKKPVKKIKDVYEEIHETFFDQYSLENNFSDVFSSGKYNCVSATGIYALALEKLSIPYVIKEEPTHVYLIAYPKSEKIIVEATDPRAGYRQYNESFKRNFIDQLVETKLIGSIESQKLTTDQLFDKYYFTRSNIKLKELVALQYYNDALYKMETKDFKFAFNQLEKSYLLYENERTGYLMYLSATSYLKSLSRNDPNYVTMILKLSRYKNYGVKNDQIIAEYGQLLQLYLFGKGEIEFNDELFEQFRNAISDSTYKSKISFIYNYETGRYNYAKGKYSIAMDYISTAYSINTSEAQAEALLVSIIAQKANRTKDIKKINVLLTKYKAMFPELVKNENFNIMLTNVKLELASYYYYTNDAEQGKRYLSEFEQQNKDDLSIDENAISKAYVSAAMYYYKKGFTYKAMVQVNKGLSILPNDFNLTRIKQMMK